MEKLGPVVVAVALFVVMGAITIAAIRKYEFDQVLRIWSAQIGVFGVIIGMMGTYFYAETSIRVVDRQRIQAVDERDEALAKIDATESKWMDAQAEINSLQGKIMVYEQSLPQAYWSLPPDANQGGVRIRREP